MAKRRKKSGRSNGTARERFTMMTLVLMQTDAWAALSSTAQALYPWLRLEWRGLDYNRNGKIRLSVRQAADRLGCSISTAARAFHDLQAKGFIVVTEPACLGLSGEAKSPAYELTELALPSATLGRKLYKSWKQGADYPVQKASANNPTGRNGRKNTCHRNDDGNVIKMMSK